MSEEQRLADFLAGRSKLRGPSERGWIRGTQRRRRAWVIALTAIYPIAAFVSLARPAFRVEAVASVLTMVTFFIASRVFPRMLRPNEADERQRSAMLEAYRLAYWIQLLSGCTLFGGLSWWQASQAKVIAIPALLVMYCGWFWMLAPSVVIAWREPDPPAEEPAI